MPPQVPVGKCSVTIPGLGVVDGLEFPSGVRQFCGIPYASLPKRWTRSELKTSWKGNYHDGTKLGNICPNPSFEDMPSDDMDLVPVPPFPHFNFPETDEKTALIMNIVLPPASVGAKLPVFVYVHGGSLLFGSSNLSIFDGVNFVSHSVALGRPVIYINFNYRVGLGGFLASAAIRDELRKDGHHGCGNFGFTDQQVAFEWVERYVRHLGGDAENVTAVGESAGGISLSNQMLAKSPARFHRAVCMSGLAFAIPAWSLEQHEELFAALCRHFSIDPASPTVLDQLRNVPEQDIADATATVQGVPSGTGNPCLDGWFHRVDPREIHPAPEWLKSFMFGDTYHEGIIFHGNILEDDYNSFRDVMVEHIGDGSYVDEILELYDIRPDTPHDKLLQRFEHMAGDAVFKMPDYLTARVNDRLRGQNALFFYHFDQRSRIKNSLEDTAYHAHELLYLFGNLDEELDQDERAMARDFATAWIEFAYGSEPWPTGDDEQKWKVWGPNSKQAVKTEAEDEEARRYSRFEKILALGEPGVTWKKWTSAIDAVVNKRMRMGKPEKK